MERIVGNIWGMTPGEYTYRWILTIFRTEAEHHDLFLKLFSLAAGGD